jgi:hypothetical protein
MHTKLVLHAIHRFAGRAARTSLWACLLLASAQALAGSDDKQGMGHHRHAGPLSASAETAARYGHDSFHSEELGGIVERWWRWYMSIPIGVDAASDPNGLNCGLNQQGAIWFYAAPPWKTEDRYCEVPYGKAIAVPLITYLSDWPCPASYGFDPAPGQSLDDLLRTDAASVVDPANSLSAKLDGRSLNLRRVATKVFGFTAAANLSQNDDCITGSPQMGLSDGYWIIIDPLPRGRHVMQFTGSWPPNIPSIQLKIVLNVR